MKYIRDYFLYLISTYRVYINFILGLLLVSVAIYWVYVTTNENLDISDIRSWWNAWGDPVLGVSTFFVAMVIWISNTAKDWEDNRDKKLTVIYKYGEREVLRCEKAYLAHEGDIRNWGQTLGRQTLGQNVNFIYNISRLEKNSKILIENKDFFKHYTATFFLASLPEINNPYENFETGKFIWKEGEKNPGFDKT